MRRQQQRPQVFRIDTSDDEPQAQPQQRIVRQRQARTPFGLNNVPIPVSSDSDRVSRQSRSDRGPLGTQPSFDQLRNEPEPA